MFKKTGDNQPIVSIYGANGEEKKCQHCGNKLLVIVIRHGGDNELVCEHCVGKEVEQFNGLGE